MAVEWAMAADPVLAAVKARAPSIAADPRRAAIAGQAAKASRSKGTQGR
ncbi:MAG: hypothetical protein IH904_06135 [Proteobacteria bacterium]|nr:hypothetical protein [Pseudomonadota bacterium]